jgi:hypothetical protein
MAGLIRNRSNQFQRIPPPEGMTGEQASSVYQGFYGEMPMPATSYATSATALQSLEIVPSIAENSANAAVVNRANRRNGMMASAGYDERELDVPQMYNSPYSSKFQSYQIGPIFNWFINQCLYRAGYPAATVMNGGRHNLALSTRVDQLVTRSSGGPGPAAMTAQPRFNAVQKIPRFSTRPKSYPTQSAQG